MKITYEENSIEKTIEINPDYESVDIYPSDDFAQVWVNNKVSGTAKLTSSFHSATTTGWMQNGAKLKKETYRID